MDARTLVQALRDESHDDGWRVESMGGGIEAAYYEPPATSYGAQWTVEAVAEGGVLSVGATYVAPDEAWRHTGTVLERTERVTSPGEAARAVLRFYDDASAVLDTEWTVSADGALVRIEA